MVQLHLLWHYKRAKKENVLPLQLPAALPHITIQVPVYNEKYVIERLLHSLTLLDYPKNKFDIQVLDDSTDETTTIINGQLTHIRSLGFQIEVIRRKERTGFKAGALQYGLPYCKGELI